MNLRSMKDLYVEELRFVCQAEKEILRKFQDLERKAEAVELRQRLGELADRTRAHLRNLERELFEVNGGLARRRSSSVTGLLDECREVLAEGVEPRVRDAAIVALCQKIDHMEIAGFGTLVEFARLLGLRDAATRLRRSLEEIKQANARLSALAVEKINLWAVES